MSDIQPGDVVVCVDDQPIQCGFGVHLGTSVKRGKTYRVTSITRQMDCRRCEILILDDITGVAQRFRKIRPADEQFTQSIRATKPVREDA